MSIRKVGVESISTFSNSNGKATVLLRCEDGTPVYLSLEGGAAAITSKQLKGYGFKKTDIGVIIAKDARTEVTIREETNPETGETGWELVGAPSRDASLDSKLDL